MISQQDSDNLCQYCHSPLLPPEKTSTGKTLRRCSRSIWDPRTQQTTGCLFVQWGNARQKPLQELCPLCKSPLVLQTTRTKKQLKKCSSAGWDPEQMVATGCPYVEWLDQHTKELDELCPRCGAHLIEQVIKGKRLKKCSTAGWNKEFRQPTGCSYVEWL